MHRGFDQEVGWLVKLATDPQRSQGTKRHTSDAAAHHVKGITKAAWMYLTTKAASHPDGC